MDFLLNKSQPLQGEAIVSEISRVATDGLTAYAQAAARTFELLWSDLSSIQDKLDRMGDLAALAFAQHYDTVTHLLRAFARAAFVESGAKFEDLSELLTDPTTWLLTHPEHPISVLVLAKMPSSTWMPPASYTIHADGTVTLN